MDQVLGYRAIIFALQFFLRRSFFALLGFLGIIGIKFLAWKAGRQVKDQRSESKERQWGGLGEVWVGSCTKFGVTAIRLFLRCSFFCVAVFFALQFFLRCLGFLGSLVSSS